MKPYLELRVEIMKHGIKHEDLAQGIGLCPASLCNRLGNKRPWTLDEAYRVLDYLELPHSELPKYFPKNGQPGKESA